MTQSLERIPTTHVPLACTLVGPLAWVAVVFVTVVYMQPSPTLLRGWFAMVLLSHDLRTTNPRASLFPRVAFNILHSRLGCGYLDTIPLAVLPLLQPAIPTRFAFSSKSALLLLPISLHFH